MKTYTVLYASDIPHYATFEVEAGSPEQALTAARAKIKAGDVLLEDPDWEGSILDRIIQIEDDAGNSVANDIPLDDYRLQNIAGRSPQGYSIGLNSDEGVCHDIVIKQDGRPIATLIATDCEVQPLVLAGNCHEILVNAARQALRELREFYVDWDCQAILELKAALEKAGAT
jgi:hypothetical protein